MRIHEDGAGPELRGQNVLLRPVVEADTPILEAILEEPGVRRWWGRASWDRVDTPNYVTFAIDVGGEVAGCIQFDEEHDPDYRRVEIDLFVSERYQNRGVGSDALRTLIDYVTRVRGHHRVTLDPSVANERAIHVYRKLGFREVGVMRRYERGEDGTWRDALLMELVLDDEGRPLE